MPGLQGLARVHETRPHLVVGKGRGGDGGGVSQMVELAGEQMAVENRGMQRMESPEIIAQANPDVILLTNYGYDRLNGSLDQIKALPGVATSNAARNNGPPKYDQRKNAEYSHYITLCLRHRWLTRAGALHHLVALGFEF